MLLYLSRIANLLTFLALAAVAGRRFPGVGWLPLAVALTPMAMFQAASASSDAPTTGLCLLVIASALGRRSSGRRGTIEAVTMCALLGLAKPPYILISLVYLIPQRDESRRDRTRFTGAVLVGFLVAGVWSLTSTHLYVPYRPLIDLSRDIRPSAQLHRIITAPWSFVAALARTTSGSLGKWLRQAVTPVGRAPAASMPVIAVLYSYALTTAAAVVPTDVHDDRTEPAYPARVMAASVGALTLLAIAVVVYSYADAVGAGRVEGIYGRYLLPVLPTLVLTLPRVRRRVPDLAFAGSAALVLTVGLIAMTHRSYGWPL